MSMGRTAVLVAAGMLAVAMGVGGCATATPHGASSDPEKEKLKIKVDVNYTAPDSLKSVKIGGLDPDPNYLLTCTKTDFDGGKCKRLGYPMKKDGSGELLSDPLSREPILILTDVASPGQTCVCYGNRCYCR